MCDKKRLKDIIGKSIKFLANEIINLEKYNCDVKKLENLFNNEKFGKLLVDESNLTFTDLIKGIFPLKLSEFISSEFKMNIEDKVKVAIRRNQNNLERKMRVTNFKRKKKLKINKKKKISIGGKGYRLIFRKK